MINSWLTLAETALASQMIVECSPYGLHKVGAEILLRIRLPNQEFRSPELILKMAERQHTVCLIDRHVVSLFADSLPQLPRLQFYTLNINPNSLIDPEVMQLLLTRLQPQLNDQSVVLELTERDRMDSKNTAGIFKAIDKLHRNGFSFAIDDFGCGYDCLGLLRRAPISFVKFSRNVIRDLTIEPRCKSDEITRDFIQVLHGHDFKTVGEGIEHLQDVNLADQIGFTYQQGFHYGRPEIVVRSGSPYFPVDYKPQCHVLY